MHQMLKAWRR